LILIVLLLTGNPAVMGTAVNSGAARALGWLTFVLMAGAVLGLCSAYSGW
jgi:hypothetical protein